jgi:MOSC domain-containing protein YiiM
MVEGRVLEICVSKARGGAKDAVDRATLRTNHGLVGDAHAGAGRRQVSLLDAADIESFREQGADVAPGAFGENLVVEGIDTDRLGVGSRLAIGHAELEISQIGKVCHDRCAIFDAVGDCIMPRKGLFAIVRAGGDITRNTPVRVLQARPRTPAEPTAADGGHGP